jgi:hypothetical protein
MLRLLSLIPGPPLLVTLILSAQTHFLRATVNQVRLPIAGIQESGSMEGLGIGVECTPWHLSPCLRSNNIQGLGDTAPEKRVSGGDFFKCIIWQRMAVFA